MAGLFPPVLDYEATPGYKTSILQSFALAEEPISVAQDRVL